MRADQSEHVIWIPVAWKVHVFEEMYELKSWLLSKLEIFVVYHLHGQTGRLTVWENGEQNSGLVNWFVPGIAFTIYTNHGFIYYRKTAAKALNWYQRWLWRNGTRIAVWRSPNGKTTTILDVPSLPEIFHWNNQKGRVPFNFQPDFLERFLLEILHRPKRFWDAIHICRVSLWAGLCLKVIVVFAFVVRKFKENRYVQAVILDSNWSYLPFTLAWFCR